jgi:hypothetical protein
LGLQPVAPAFFADVGSHCRLLHCRCGGRQAIFLPPIGGRKESERFPTPLLTHGAYVADRINEIVSATRQLWNVLFNDRVYETEKIWPSGGMADARDLKRNR